MNRAVVFHSLHESQEDIGTALRDALEDVWMSVMGMMMICKVTNPREDLH